MNIPKQVFIDTYGCQMNILDSELVQEQLQALGYQFTTNAADADVVLLNTCSVRQLAEQKVWSQLGRLAIEKRENNNDLVIGVLGCMAEREGAELVKRMPHIDVLCGPSELDKLPGLLQNVMQNRQRQVALSGHTSRRSATLDKAEDGVEALDLSRSFSATRSSKQAYVRITRGCNKFCTYCVVPYTRGPEVHRPPLAIVQEVRSLVDQGVLEVTLLGQTVNHYVSEDGGKTTSFADLLAMIHDKVPELHRLRFLTSYPRDFDDAALDVMAASPRICKYLHIPAQSGSNEMLRKMNRGYSVEIYLSLIERARARMPRIRFAGDIIVGFPGETEADHEATRTLIQKVRYKSCYIFKYSPRSGTVADRRFVDDVPDEVKKLRNRDLLDLQNGIALEIHSAMIGQEIDVIVEGFSPLRVHRPQPGEVQLGWDKRSAESTSHVRLMGRTQGDEIIAFEGGGDLVGKLVTVKVTEATQLSMRGQLVDYCS